MDSSIEERLLSPEAEGLAYLKRRIWEETKKTWRIAFPGMLSRVASFGMLVVTVIYWSH